MARAAVQDRRAASDVSRALNGTWPSDRTVRTSPKGGLEGAHELGSLAFIGPTPRRIAAWRRIAHQKSKPADADSVVCAAAVSLASQRVVIAPGGHAIVAPAG